MRIKNSLVAAVAALSLSSVASAETVNVSVWYTEPAAQSVGDMSARIDSFISVANRIYENNDLDIQLEVVDSRKYSDEDMRISGESLNDFSGLAEYMEQDDTPTYEEIANVAPGYIGEQRGVHGADMAILLGKAYQEGNSISCGIAWIGIGSNGVMDPASKRLAYSMTAVDCGGADLTFVHELGHNMGLTHSRRQGDTSGGVYTYGLGHGVNNSFSTIMAYPHYFGSAERLDTFSDPDKICNGRACGVNNRADAHRALEPILDDIAGYY
ncbi:zinc-dependent metalloprotease family protein [Microbulbifer epialgicus]|uniref:Zinc-dependent metalloprotease family protein n=1 Tax=Microbulbifer epialgicus TaxID=393907 RepID=A0ABV4NXN9_9GAMM